MRYSTAHKALDGFFSLARTTVRSAAWLGVAYFAFLSVQEIAGKTTTFSAVLRAAITVGADRWIAYVVAAICTGGYIHERRLRRRTARELGQHSTDLEELVDPKRSSSGLATTGEPKRKE